MSDTGRVRSVRPAAVAGLFYPDDPGELRALVESMVQDAAGGARTEARQPAKAYLLPHAGYVYSGPTAARGYGELARARGAIERVILLGPTHRVPVHGLALPEVDGLATPLGQVRAVRPAPALRNRLPQLVDAAAVHTQEHSLEVHLPFLQVALGDVEVLPLAVGRAAPDVVADVLDAFWGGPETVVVISSDLSHYHPYEQAQEIDGRTVDQLLTLAGPITHDQACGATPANGLLVAAARRRLTPRLLGLCNSGDTAGDKRRVVGYAALGFDEPAA